MAEYFESKYAGEVIIAKMDNTENEVVFAPELQT